MIIADATTAHRIGMREVFSRPGAIGFTIFQYEQPGSRLTLYGAAIRFRDGTQQEVRTQ